MVRSALKYGSVKARFTVNVTYHQTLAAPAVQAVRVVVLKDQHRLADAATKEAASVAANAEAVVTEEVVTRVAVIVAVVVKIARVAVVVKTVVEVIVPVDQAEDNIDL